MSKRSLGRKCSLDLSGLELEVNFDDELREHDEPLTPVQRARVEPAYASRGYLDPPSFVTNGASRFAEELSERVASLAYAMAAAYEQQLKSDPGRAQGTTNQEACSSDDEAFKPDLDQEADEIRAYTSEGRSEGSLPDDSPRRPISDSRSEWYTVASSHTVKSGATSDFTTKIGRFELKDAWLDAPRTEFQRHVSRKLSHRLRRTVTSQLIMADDEGGESVHRSHSWLGRRMTHPTSWKRFTWDILGITFMLYDTIIIPMQVFELKWGTPLMLMGFVTLGYWSLDILLSFFVGYYTRGVLEMRPLQIAVHYATTWMLLDVSIVSLDWVIQVLTDGDTEGIGGKSTHLSRFARTMRSLRVLRSLRLLRLLKMRHLMNEVQERINNEYVLITLRMVKLIVAIALLNHFIACFWWYIGKTTDGWIKEARVDERDVGYCYTTSFHWSLTQFTPASMEIVPTNVYERTYAVCVLLFAMVIFSSFVSSITATMTHLRQLHGKLGKTKQFKMLRLYLKDNRVPLPLQQKIQRFLQHAVMLHKMHVQEGSVELLAYLSAPLRDDLRATILKANMNLHPLFQRCYVVSPQAMRQTCSQAVSPLTISMGDVLFTTGEVSKKMYLIGSGTLHYQIAQRGGMRAEADASILLHPNQYISELSLWTTWVHAGELLAHGNSHFLVVTDEPFANVIKSHYSVYGSVRRYAAAIVTEAAERERQTTLSDLAFEKFDYGQVLESSFPPETRWGNTTETRKLARTEEDEMDRQWDNFQSRLHAMARSV